MHNSESEHTTPSPILSLRKVSHNYPIEHNKILAIKDISFEINGPEIIAIVGPSGCGKSTIIKIAAGLITPTEGTVSASGNDPTKTLQPHAGLVAQEPILFPWLTVKENLLFPVSAARQKAARSSNTILNLIQMTGESTLYPHQLSGGMRSRVALGRALMLNPSILLMDEPFGALDEMTSQTLCDELLQIWNETSTAILIVTHNITQAAYLAQKVIVLSPRPGKVIDIVDIPSPHKRDQHTYSDKAFINTVQHIRKLTRQFHNG